MFTASLRTVPRPLLLKWLLLCTLILHFKLRLIPSFWFFGTNGRWREKKESTIVSYHIFLQPNYSRFELRFVSRHRERDFFLHNSCTFITEWNWREGEKEASVFQVKLVGNEWLRLGLDWNFKQQHNTWNIFDRPCSCFCFNRVKR